MVGAGESASLIDSILTVEQIIDDTVATFWREVERLARMVDGATSRAG